MKKCKLGKDFKGHQQSVMEKKYFSKTNTYAVVNTVSTSQCFTPILQYPQYPYFTVKKQTNIEGTVWFSYYWKIALGTGPKIVTILLLGF